MASRATQPKTPADPEPTIHVDPLGHQSLGVLDALVAQRIEAVRLDEGGREPRDALGPGGRRESVTRQFTGDRDAIRSAAVEAAITGIEAVLA